MVICIREPPTRHSSSKIISFAASLPKALDSDMASHLKAAGKAILNSPKALKRKFAGNHDPDSHHDSEFVSLPASREVA